MTESDGEIEYLEEDAEIVQQCVQSINTNTASSLLAATATPKPLVPQPLLVERPQVQKKRRVKEEDDSEYDPSEDVMPPSPPSPPVRKRKVPMKKTKPASTVTSVILKNIATKALLNRKKLNIRIPDFDDPLCLPVRAIKHEEGDTKRLDNWNNVCLEHFKHCDTLLKPERGNTKRSVRTSVFRNVINKQTGNKETTIWSKTCVENEEGDKKSEIFQCILPQYKEKKVLGNYILGHHRIRAANKTVSEVILSMEKHNDGRALVVYKPQESLSAVYGMIDKGPDVSWRPAAGAGRVSLAERCAARVCVRCYQAGARGPRAAGDDNTVECPICSRTFSTAQNLLSHFKAHSSRDVYKHKKSISQVLADVVDYHYKCRICQEQLESIKLLRQHVLGHQSKERFTCEVCNKTMNG